MKILICGGRDFKDQERFDYEMDIIHAKFIPTTIISGMARGADKMGVEYAKFHNLELEKFPALWDVHGRAAGPIRNQLMLDEGQPDLVIAFPGGSGTAHMVRISKAAGVEVIQIDN